MNELISLAYYLPQFHEVEENNLWWGKSYTEWTALSSAKKFYNWQIIRKPVAPHYEYDLTSGEVLEWQNKLATDHGITGFFMWDYWFGKGERLLDKPAKIALNENLNFNYCFMWANHSWYNKKLNLLLKKQHYLGKEDYLEYFNECLPHFLNNNYIKIDGKPVFGIFNPSEVPDLECFVETFREAALKSGLTGIYFIAENTTVKSSYVGLFDRFLRSGKYFYARRKRHPISFVKEQLIKRLRLNFIGPVVYDYSKLMSEKYSTESGGQDEIPVIYTGWDTTPRHGERGTILKGFDLESFNAHQKGIKKQLEFQRHDVPLIIIKSWNEWAEGNLMEPDSVYGDDLLKAFNVIFHDAIIT
tara:strand:- start:17401 stop:18474 length:1074 start_codon:yes stop_codon:yes gene_type:complete